MLHESVACCTKALRAAQSVLQVRDLLHPSTPSKNIVIRETAAGDIIVAGSRDEAAPRAHPFLLAAAPIPTCACSH